MISYSTEHIPDKLIIQLKIPGGTNILKSGSDGKYEYLETPLGEYGWDNTSMSYVKTDSINVYTYFNKIKDYINWSHDNIFPEERCFYETILNHNNRAMYYDIDVNFEKDYSKNTNEKKELLISNAIPPSSDPTEEVGTLYNKMELIKDKIISNTIMIIYNLFGIETDIVNDVVIKTSYLEGIKYSCHIKFNNCIFKNYQDCIELYNKVIY